MISSFSCCDLTPPPPNAFKTWSSCNCNLVNQTQHAHSVGLVQSPSPSAYSQGQCVMTNPSSGEVKDFASEAAAVSVNPLLSSAVLSESTTRYMKWPRAFSHYLHDDYYKIT